MLRRDICAASRLANTGAGGAGEGSHGHGAAVAAAAQAPRCGSAHCGRVRRAAPGTTLSHEKSILILEDGERALLEAAARDDAAGAAMCSRINVTLQGLWQTRGLLVLLIATGDAHRDNVGIARRGDHKQYAVLVH